MDVVSSRANTGTRKAGSFEGDVEQERRSQPAGDVEKEAAGRMSWSEGEVNRCGGCGGSPHVATCRDEAKPNCGLKVYFKQPPHMVPYERRVDKQVK